MLKALSSSSHQDAIYYLPYAPTSSFPSSPALRVHVKTTTCKASGGKHIECIAAVSTGLTSLSAPEEWLEDDMHAGDRLGALRA